MTYEILLRYLHFISVFVIAGTLIAEAAMLKARMTRAELRRVVIVDAAYGAAVVVLLIAGFTLWLGSYGKPSAFYSGNWVFHAKLSLFLLVGLLSAYPTVFFLRHRKGDAADTVVIPDRVRWLVRAELVLLAIIPFLANLMAKGIGL